MVVQFTVDVVRSRPDILLEDFRKAPAEQRVSVVLHWPGIALEYGAEDLY
jgi:hypothetical protein